MKMAMALFLLELFMDCENESHEIFNCVIGIA